MFKLEFETDNAFFQDFMENGVSLTFPVVEILDAIASELKEHPERYPDKHNPNDPYVIRDGNGNRIGRWSLTDDI